MCVCSYLYTSEIYCCLVLENQVLMLSFWFQDVAKKIGEAIAKSCIEKGITAVAFDRGGYPYHGRIQALADAAREHGLQF